MAVKNARTGRRPTRTTTGRSGADAIALIKADHAMVSEQFRTYQGLGPRATKRRRQIAERVIKELSVHAGIEEELLYPVARKNVPGGANLVKEAKNEHRQLKRLLARLDKLDAEDARMDPLMMQVKQAVEHHVAEEEGPGGILAGMRKAMARKDLEDLGSELRRAKRMAPTHPHPNAPDSPAAH